MRTIRASEIGTFLYCQRAWWYHKLGKPCNNQKQLDTGTEFHLQHGQKVARARFYRLVGWLVLLAGILLLAVSLVLQIKL